MAKRGVGVELLLSSEAGLDASRHALREAVREFAAAETPELRAFADASCEAYAELQQLLLKLRSQRARAAGAVEARAA